MSDYSGVGAGFRIVVLILLVGVLALGGLVWFDYLGVVDARRTLAPVFALFAVVPVGPQVTVLGQKVALAVFSPDAGILYVFALSSLRPSRSSPSPPRRPRRARRRE